MPRTDEKPKAQRNDDHPSYQECYYIDPECPRFPCRVYREGRQDERPIAYGEGFRDGEAVGYANGYANGHADGAASAGGKA